MIFKYLMILLFAGCTLTKSSDGAGYAELNATLGTECYIMKTTDETVKYMKKKWTSSDEKFFDITYQEANEKYNVALRTLTEICGKDRSSYSLPELRKIVEQSDGAVKQYDDKYASWKAAAVVFNLRLENPQVTIANKKFDQLCDDDDYLGQVESRLLGQMGSEALESFKTKKADEYEAFNKSHDDWFTNCQTAEGLIKKIYESGHDWAVIKIMSTELDKMEPSMKSSLDEKNRKDSIIIDLMNAFVTDKMYEQYENICEEIEELDELQKEYNRYIAKWSNQTMVQYYSQIQDANNKADNAKRKWEQACEQLLHDIKNDDSSGWVESYYSKLWEELRGHLTGVEAPQPGVEAPQPEVDTTESEVDTTESDVDTSQPDVDT